jgi:sugar phosphate isomerase/epimerase
VKLACQEGMVPGASFAEKLDNMAGYGYEGVELGGRGLLERLDELESALAGHSVQVSTICAGFRGSPLSVDRAERQQALDDIKALLEAAGRLKAVGLIAVPIFGPPRLPDLSPWKTAVELEYELLAVEWSMLAEHARKAGTLLLLEPLNRYETHLIRRLEQGVEVLRRVDNPGTALMADFFHMSIEEADISSALRQNAAYVAHIHLADSNRLQPGMGHTDFRTPFQALKEAGYTGYMALECGIAGDDRGLALTQCAQYLKEAMC